MNPEHTEHIVRESLCTAKAVLSRLNEKSDVYDFWNEQVQTLETTLKELTEPNTSESAPVTKPAKSKGK